MKLRSHSIANTAPLFLIAGPCVIEEYALLEQSADQLKKITTALGMGFAFKASFDKANRSSHLSYRGPGLHEGLNMLAQIKQDYDVPIVTDVHTPDQAEAVAQVADILQIPAFLARQTDLVQACAATGKFVNAKKAQFMAPGDMQHVVSKVAAVEGRERLMLCERGTSFGYQNLVVDMRGIEIMKATGCPVIFDATHSVQLPGSSGQTSGGQREFIPTLARAAVAVGVAGIFMETHPNPAQAKSDAANAWPLDQMHSLLTQLVAIDRLVKHLD